MKWFIGMIGALIGSVLAKLLPALFDERRKHKGTVRQIGADDETMEKIDSSIRDAACDDGLQPKD